MSIYFSYNNFFHYNIYYILGIIYDIFSLLIQLENLQLFKELKKTTFERFKKKWKINLPKIKSPQTDKTKSSKIKSLQNQIHPTQLSPIRFPSQRTKNIIKKENHNGKRNRKFNCNHDCITNKYPHTATFFHRKFTWAI